MTIPRQLNSFKNKAMRVFENIRSVDCLKHFRKYNDNRKIAIVIKVALIAAAVGIITGALLALASPVVGAIVGVSLAVYAGVYAFGHYTMTDPTVQNCIDGVKDDTNDVMRYVKRIFKNI